MCLLYRKRIGTHESPGLTILDLERLTGCTREELTYALWYLCEKKWASIVASSTPYAITADGFDVVESKLEERLEFRALATLSYYGVPAELEDPSQADPQFWINDVLSLDIEPAMALEGDVSVADHYEVLGLGEQADEEAIERVYETLASRFHPDNPITGDAKTFLRIGEAYDTLSDQTRREQYNALRQRTRDSTRFRLRGREFFDGIRGEQLRRLAVLCLLYRQAASESPGLTVLDLERLTGCTREELGSPLWYLREKKWANSGEFTQYSITAAGFDVVENKLDAVENRPDREASRPRGWLNPEDTQGSEFVILQAGAAQMAALESPRNVEVTQMPIPIEEAPVMAKPVTRFEDQAKPESREAAGSWSWLYPDEAVAIKPGPELLKQVEDGAEARAPETTPSPAEPAPEVSHISRMSNSTSAIAEPARAVAACPRKRVVFSMGGKGGVGKTSVMTALAEWFEENRIPVTLLDLDTENKVKGSLTHFFGSRRAEDQHSHPGRPRRFRRYSGRGCSGDSCRHGRGRRANYPRLVSQDVSRCE